MLSLDDLDIHYKSADHNAAYVEVLRAIEEKKPCPTKEQWDKHWARHEGPTHPNYLDRGSCVFRHIDNFVRAAPGTELQFFTELKRRLFKEYLSDVTALAEFGCGTGHNLKQYGEMFPCKPLFGYDWSTAACNLVDMLPNCRSQIFDMKHPTHWEQHAVTGTGAVLTCGSMEQLGEEYHDFLQFLARIKPAICVHVEPCVELYDESKLFDRVAAMYHRSRGYLGRWIAEVEKLGEVLLKHRTRFGNIYNEGYSVVVWRPR